MDSPEKIAIGLIAYVVLLFSLSFHESAHAWMARRMGDNTAHDDGRISLNPLVHIDPIGTFLLPLMSMFVTGYPGFGWAKPTPVVAANFRQGLFRTGQVLVAAAGPLSNVILCLTAALGILVAVRGRLITRDDDFVTILFTVAVQTNVSLALFNLLPIPPLDGSWWRRGGCPAISGSVTTGSWSRSAPSFPSW